MVGTTAGITTKDHQGLSENVPRGNRIGRYTVGNTIQYAGKEPLGFLTHKLGIFICSIYSSGSQFCIGDGKYIVALCVSQRDMNVTKNNI